MAKKFSGLEVVCIPFPGCLASWAETHLPLRMDLPVLDQGHLLAKDFSDKRAGLIVVGSVEQRNPCSRCIHHCVPRPSSPNQAELGDPRTLQMERSAWGQAGMGKVEKAGSQGEAR